MGGWPMFGLAADVRPFLGAAAKAGEGAALVTLVAANGGGPRRPGAQMAVTEDAIAGYLSGGCIEPDVAVHARDCLRDGTPRRLVYGEGSPYFDIRLLCGRRIELLVERVVADDPALSRLLTLTRQRREALWLSDGVVRNCLAVEDPLPPGWATPPDAGEDAGVFADGRIWVRYRSAIRLFIHGRDPAALAMAMLGAQAGFETVLVRPNGPEAPPPIAGIAYRRELPEIADHDSRTAVVAASHDTQADHAALVLALNSKAAYVGLMGARAHLDGRLAALRAAGISPERLARLKAPVGLPLNSHTPWEVAVSVIGEIMQFFNGGAR